MTIPPHCTRDNLQRLLAHEEFGQARSVMREWATLTTDYRDLTYLTGVRQKLPSHPAKDPLRVAFLSDATNNLLRAPLELACEAVGLDCSWHHGGFDTYAFEMLNPASETNAYQPQVVVLLLTPANLSHRPAGRAHLDAMRALATDTAAAWVKMCQTIHERCGSDVILNNLHALPTRQLGNADAATPWSDNAFIRLVNASLAERLPPYVHLVDIDYLASRIGIDNWFDARYWHHGKQPVGLAGIAPYVQNVANVMGALRGRSAKCLILDLDDTLWGGVVGEDGLDGIVLGQGSGIGEAFQAFQHYLKRLKERGVILAVCSKNDEARALEVFAKHTEMILTQDDIVSFVANWRHKTENILDIAQALNIGLDACVFVDDNPRERALVRQTLPSVRVLEIGDDPASFPGRLDATGWFESIAVADQDVRRTEQYQQNRERSAMEAGHDYANYLVSLDQRAVIRPFEEQHFDRITQLANKTNQFNLTTRRMQRAEVVSEAKDPARITRYVRLADRFGDNGLISVFSASRSGDTLEIDQWLMSCRVFQREVEYALFNHVVAEACQTGCTAVIGRYIPTPRNDVVAMLYSDLGFERMGDANNTTWRLLLDDYTDRPTSITIVEDL